MEVLYARCCGLDVHRSKVVACVSVIESFPPTERNSYLWDDDQRITATAKVGLSKSGVATSGWRAPESCGVRWLIGWLAILNWFSSRLSHMKRVPGRKTDVQDAEWRADLLQHGLLTPSFVLDQPQQDLRDLTRLRIHGARKIACNW